MIWSDFLRFSPLGEPVWIPGQRCRRPAAQASAGTMAGAPVPCQQRALSDLARKEGAGWAPAAPRYGRALSGAFISIEFWQPRSSGYLGEATPVVLNFHFPSSSSF